MQASDNSVPAVASTIELNTSSFPQRIALIFMGLMRRPVSTKPTYYLALALARAFQSATVIPGGSNDPTDDRFAGSSVGVN